MWLGIGVIFFVVIGGDAIFGIDESLPKIKYPSIVEIPLHLALPLLAFLLMTLFWSCGTGSDDFLYIGSLAAEMTNYDVFEARASNTLLDFFGGVLGVGFLMAGYGINAGHEFSHRVTSPRYVAEGRWILSLCCLADFAIEHVYGHHARVGWEEDPATARRGENVYAFSVRSAVRGHQSAWNIENKRLRKKGHGIFFWRNRMIRGYLMSGTWMALGGIAGGPFGILLFFSQSLFARFILEVVNYMEHYGLHREKDEPVHPHHSWNTNKLISGIVLFSLNRHSAHHERATVPFWKLDPYPDAPQMPYGYLSTIVLCLLPPLWFRIINPKLEEWDQQFASTLP